jgi:hypothetical protein
LKGENVFTTKTIKIFDENILKPKTKLHIWYRGSYDEEMYNNDIWYYDYEAEVNWVGDDELSIINLDYNTYEKIIIEDIENKFVKIEIRR